MAIEIFCCYARKDQPLLKELKEHLFPLQRQGLITIWADIDIGAGKEWEKEIEKHLYSADVILLLVSASFLASEYCWSVEMTQALKRHKAGEALVIPIILRPCAWHVTPFARLQVLPDQARPVTDWRNRHEPFNGIALEISEIATGLLMEKKGIVVKKKDDLKYTPLVDIYRGGKVVDEQLASNPNNIISEVLSIIGYEEDKDQYAAEFIDLVEKQALLDCLQALPADRQEAFKLQMSTATDPDQVKEIIKQYVGAQEYTEALQAASQDAFTKFIESLLPELDEEEKDQLRKYLMTLSWGIATLPSLVPTASSSNAPTDVQIVPAPIEPTSPMSSLPLSGQTSPDFSDIPQGMGVLYIEKGKEPGRIYKIDKKILSIGREKINDIILEDSQISRKHASVLDMGFGVYVLRDEGSSNGTKLNGQLLSAHQNYTLRDDDRIDLGQTQLIFATNKGDDNQPTARLKPLK